MGETAASMLRAQVVTTYCRRRCPCDLDGEAARHRRLSVNNSSTYIENGISSVGDVLQMHGMYHT